MTQTALKKIQLCFLSIVATVVIELNTEMGKVGLQICCTFENVSSLKTSHPDYSFFFKIKCSNCGEQSNKYNPITESEKDNEDSRNPNGFNFFMKCKLCARENSINIVEGSNGNVALFRKSFAIIINIIFILI